jgi:hypothetical protein
MRQARLALLAYGLLSQVDAALAALPSPQREAAQIEWEYAADLRRDHPLVQSLKYSLIKPDGTPVTDGDLDGLFIAAEGIA